MSLVRRLRPPHPHHRLAHDIGRLQWAPEYAHGEHAAAAKTCECVIACLEAIFGPQRSCKLSTQHHHCATVATLGIRSLSIHLPVTRPPDRIEFRPALASLRRSVRELSVAFGRGSSRAIRAAADAEKELLAAQSRLATEDAAAFASLEECSFCGWARASAIWGGGEAEAGREAEGAFPLLPLPCLGVGAAARPPTAAGSIRPYSGHCTRGAAAHLLLPLSWLFLLNLLLPPLLHSGNTR